MAQNTTNDETPRKPIRCNQGTVEEARLRDCIRLLTPMKGKRISTNPSTVETPRTTYAIPQEIIDQALECNDE